MAKPRKYPIESFGPEIMAALTKGSTETVVIHMPTWRAAVRFQQRLHMLRKAMRDSNHPLYPATARVSCKLEWGADAGYGVEVKTVIVGKGNRVPENRDTKTRVTLSPRDSEFTEVLQKAGLKPDELKYDPIGEMAMPTLIEPTQPTEDIGGAIDALFGINPEQQNS